MELPEPHGEQDDAMLHMAHASAHHWRSEGSGATANNLARSEWQVSRVYTVLGRAEPAGYHARRCLEICQDNGIGDWDLGYAYEALARAAVTAGDTEAARSWAAQAHAAAGPDRQGAVTASTCARTWPRCRSRPPAEPR